MIESAREIDSITPRNCVLSAPRWVHAWAWGVFGAIFFALLILFALYRDTDIWFLWMGNEAKVRGTFAEAITPGIFRTQANTWSNLAYVLVGLYIFTLACWDARRPTSDRDPYAVRQPALAGLYGVACVVLGFGSGLMHASMMPFGHKLDVFGMFFTASALICLQWARWFPGIRFRKSIIPTSPIFCVSAIGVSILLLRFGRVLGGGELVLGTLCAIVGIGVGVDAIRRTTSQQFRWLFLALVTLAVGGYLQRQDVGRRFTPSDSWLQGHAIWHLLTATTLGSMACFYRSEMPFQRNLAEPTR